jgi:hypothetical protein
LAASFAEGFQKTPAILIVLAKGLSPISPVQHVVDRAWIVHSQFARPAANAFILGLSVKVILDNSRD